MARTQTRDLNEVTALFEQWRQSRRGKARIPDELWAAAVEVAHREGCNPTAVALHLDGGKLRKRMLAAGAVTARRKKTPPASFLELIAPEINGAAQYTIELEGRGGMLRIHCKGVSAAELAALSKALWSSAS